MIGYIGEMGSAQLRHFPRNHSHANIGTLSYARIGVRHRGHRDPGATIDSPSGMRVIHTFKKLPITIPNTKNSTEITI
jgi:hypothetical protein